MISRGEVGLIVTAMGASTGIFGQAEVAVMVAVVLLTTILTPVALRWAFSLKSRQDVEEGLETDDSFRTKSDKEEMDLPVSSEPSANADPMPEEPMLLTDSSG